MKIFHPSYPYIREEFYTNIFLHLLYIAILILHLKMVRQFFVQIEYQVHHGWNQFQLDLVILNITFLEYLGIHHKLLLPFQER